MALPLKGEINPKGTTTEARLEDLVRQLQRQNKELKIIIEDLYKNTSTEKPIATYATKKYVAELIGVIENGSY